MDILSTFNTRRTSQSEQADPHQSKNAAGGFTFTPDDATRLHRFLTLGTDGGTYYTSAKDITRENAEIVFRAATNDAVELVRHIVEVSVGGRAPKQNPALFALAIAASHADDAGRAAALAALPRIARTGTHLFLFTSYVEQFRGWGRGLRKAVGRWYDNRNPDKLAYQLVKYRAREDWRHYDTLRLASDRGGRSGHNRYDMTPFDDAHAALYNWVAAQYAAANRNSPRFNRPANIDRDGHELEAELPALIHDFEDVQVLGRPQTVTGKGLVDRFVDIINRGNGISWEMLPDIALSHPEIWEALLEQGVPQTALMRQLPRLTRLGVTKGRLGTQIAGQLADTELLKRGRVHPINVLVAQRTYTSGRSARGESTWTPDRKISDALDAAFYAAYGAVEPANKRTLLALDISGSMSFSVSGLPLSCREACAALAMVTAATEPDYQIVGFTSASGVSYDGTGNLLTELDISPRRRLDDICRYTSQLRMGRTDCALPMVWALKNKVPIDTFNVYTDNETWFGSIHPHQALREYREKMGIDARMCVVAMTANGSTIADPTDPKQLDVSGFDSAVPNLISDFSRGDI